MKMRGETDDLFDIYFELVKDTEPPAIFHRWSLIGSIGAWLGRNYWFPFGASRLFPNHYIMFVGDPGTRKSTAIKMASKMIGLAGYETFAANRTSKEKFLQDLSGDLSEVAEDNRGSGKGIDILKNLRIGGDDADEDTTPREMFIAADEFNNFVGSGNIEFLSLLGELWDWDEPSRPYKQRLKSSKSIAIYQPTISILGGNTPTQFAECFPASSIGQGFMSRLILIHGSESGKKITFPSPLSEELQQNFLQRLLDIKRLCLGPATMETSARDALDAIYKSWPELDDSRFRHYSTRRFTHLLKLCLVCSAIRATTKIGIRDVVMANTLLAHAETTMPKAIGELGKSKSSEAANKLMQALYAAREPKEVKDLWKVVQHDLDKIADLSTLLISLQQADKIQTVQLASGKSGFLAKHKIMSRKLLYVDESILKGKELK